MRFPRRMGTAALLFAAAGSARADQFHYNNVIFGERAMGLGGAYAGVADDASGVVHNPAGMAFALSNDISGSANAFYSKRIVYKNTLGNKPFVEKSKGSLAPFFGVLQKLDNVMPGLVFAFGITTLDSELKDQDDVIEGVRFSQLTPDAAGILNPAYATAHRIHRGVTSRATTQLYSVGVAKRIGQSFSLGFAVHLRSIDELVQEYQDNQVQADGGKPTQIIQNIRDKLSAMALEPTIGVQWAFAPRWSLGLTAKFSTNLSQTLNRSIEKSSYNYTLACVVTPKGGTTSSVVTGKTCAQAAADGSVDPANNSLRDAQAPDNGLTFHDVYKEETEDPMGALPVQYRGGLAFFASQRLLWTFDVTHFGEAKGGKSQLYKREAVTNMASGIEYYVTPTIPLRFGMFTNNDARPKLKRQNGRANPKAADQADHIDFYGTSVFVGWVQPNSQLSLGVVNQFGSGQAQKTGGYEIQNVKASATTIAFSASNNF